MPVKLRLQRHGKKGKPFYHIVAADSRAPRNGKFIEKVGTYNPNTNPATIDLNLDAAVQWLQNGAQPTDTTRAILSYKGAMYKNHLLKGVAKGAFTAEEADKKFDAWMEQKLAKVQAKVDTLSKADADKLAAQLAKEKEQNEARAKAIADELAAANAPEEVAEEAEATEEAATEEAPAADEATEENKEA